MRWSVLTLLCACVPLKAQSINDFPVISNVSHVVLVGYTLFFDLSPTKPHPDFRVWFVEMEECTELSGDFDAIKWYQSGQIINPAQGKAYWGMYFQTPQEIVLRRRLSPERLENTVKHEILHHLTQNGHDEELFGRCLPFGLEH